jgi:hypothetical protein
MRGLDCAPLKFGDLFRVGGFHIGGGNFHTQGDSSRE